MAGKEKPRALGTGLSALFGSTELEEEYKTITSLPISKIEPRIEQPRDYFDEEALQTLADSISQHGIIQPITVRRLDTGYYQIIAGERRWRASRLAGLLEVPVRIIEADDRTTAELALVENLQREDLNPIEEAKGYKTLMDEYHLTQEETAKSVGKSRPAITNAIRLLNLSPDVLSLVENGDLSAGHARALLSVNDASMQLEAAKEIMSKSLSVRKAEQLTAKVMKRNEDSAQMLNKSPSEDVDYADEVSKNLTKALGRKVTLTENKNSGRIVIDFYGADDREALIALLLKKI